MIRSICPIRVHIGAIMESIKVLDIHNYSLLHIFIQPCDHV